MPERQTSITPVREEQRRLARHDPFGDWSASPLRALQRFADEVDRMFDDVGIGRRWGSWPTSGERTTSFAWAPEVDIVQKNNELTVKVDLPGLKRDEVTVDVSEDAITIQGERRRESEEEREGFYRSERSYGSFYRVIPLPEGAITDEAKATFRDGVLEITMPAPPKSKGRRLEIAEGGKK
jgi:HSP20 family protein